MDKDIVISIKTILLTFGLFGLVYLFIRLGPILAVLFVALLLVLALEPAVMFFKGKTFMNKPVPRSIAVALTYVLFLIALVFILTVGLPPVLSQSQKLINNLAGQLQELTGFDEFRQLGTRFLPDISSGVVSATFSIFSNALAVFSLIFLSIYISLDWENLKKKFKGLFSGKLKSEISSTIEEIETNIGHWVKGQLALMVIVGLSSFFGLLILGVNYSLALGLISGLLEIVPVLGPVVSAVLAAIVGFSESPIKGFAALGLYVLIQQLENNFLVPKVMQKVSGFSPLVILIALLIGNNFFGAAGAVLAVPVTMILAVVLKRVLRYNPQ